MPDSLTRLGATLVAICVAPVVALGQPLQSELEQLAKGSTAPCTSGVVLIDGETGELLAEHEADEPLVPASNMKLLTAAAGLRILGPDFEFRTELQWDEANRRLIVKGSGDPAFGDPMLLEEMGLTPEGFVDVWVGAVEAAGLNDIRELVVDDRVFDAERVHPSWPPEQLNRWYCAEVAGLNFHTNCLEVYVSPDNAGRPALLRTQPSAPWIELSNTTNSVREGRQTVWASRAQGTNEIRMHGDVRFTGEPVEVTVHDPPMFFADIFEHRLKSKGFDIQTVRRAGIDEHLTGNAIHVIRTPIAVVLRRILVNSQNMYAEALLKRMGETITKSPGSWDSGCAALRMVLVDRLGPTEAERITCSDGSGMSRDNRVTARSVARWTYDALTDAGTADLLLESMATAGEGTLSKRFRGASLSGAVHAKTGYLRGVSALSGIVIHPETGRTVIFTSITNDCPSRVPLRDIRLFEEAVVKLADTWLERQSQTASSPGG